MTESLLARGRPRAEEALERALGWLSALVAPELVEPIRHGVLTGGKRLRPILCVSAYSAVQGDGEDEAAWDLAVSIELIHAYSLMHDDLPSMDDADLRRGRPTPHRIHGERRTARAAAALIPAAALQAWRAGGALGLEEGERRELVATLARAAGGAGMVGGQVLDLLAEGRELGPEELDDLHSRKTGALLAAALRMGGLAARAEAPVLEALEGYGKAVGLAFQIADDVLDATASAGALGKNPSDHHLGKSTYVSLYGVEEARRRARRAAELGCQGLRTAGIHEPALEALAHYVVDRER